MVFFQKILGRFKKSHWIKPFFDLSYLYAGIKLKSYFHEFLFNNELILKYFQANCASQIFKTR